MWLTEFMAKNLKTQNTASRALISGSKDSKVGLFTDSKHTDVPVVSPYGVIYSPPAKEDAVMINAQGKEVCLGVLMPAAKELEAGEVMLCSKGASLVLKNDGRVLINGKELGGY